MSDVKLFNKIKLPLVPSKLVQLANQYEQLIVYALFGAMALALDLAIFKILNANFGVNPYIANTISIFISMMFSFSLNAHLNFKTKDKLLARFASFASVTAFGYGVSQVVLWFGINTLELSDDWSKVLTLPFVFVVQYALNKRFTFKATEK